MVIDVVLVQYLIHGRQRDGPGIHGSFVQDAHIVKRINVKKDAGLLHLAVEGPGLRAGDSNLGADQIARRATAPRSTVAPTVPLCMEICSRVVRWPELSAGTAEMTLPRTVT